MKDIVLGGGLDLINPKSMVKPGYLEDCFNYEVGVYDGYQPSEGFERFDGRMSPSTRDIWDMVIPNTSITPAYMNKTFSVAAELTTASGLAFSSDGHKAYTISSSSRIIYQYYLSTAWDASTGFYTGVSFSAATEATDAWSLGISVDGTKIYVCDWAGNTIYQYNLVIPWDLSTASYSGLSLTVTASTGVCFKPDGTQAYFCTNGTQVQHYTLATPWAINTGSLTNTYTPGDISNAEGVQFHPDGYVFYVLDDTTDTIRYYSCATPWVLSTASSANKTFSLSGQQTDSLDIFLRPDGGILYSVGRTPDALHQWGINPNINENMTWTLLDQSGDLGVVIDVDVGAEDTTVRFAYWDLDDALSPGALVTGDVSGVTFREGLESTQYASKTIDTTAQDSSAQGIFFRPTGLTMYVAGDTGNAIDQWTLSTAWDVSTATYATKTFSTAGETTDVRGIALSSDGTKAYVLSPTNVYQYTLSPAWDLNGGVYASKTLLFSAKEPAGTGMAFSADGTSVYIVGAQQTVFQYTLSTAWDISTASFTSSYVLEFLDNSFEESGNLSIAFNSAGTVFYLARYYLSDVYEYACATAWSVASVTPTGAMHSFLTDPTGTPANVGSIQDLFIKPDDKAIFILIAGDTVYEYTLYPDATFTALAATATNTVDYQSELAAAATVLRSAITPVPGFGPVLGVKWFDGDLYAIRDYYTFRYTGGDAPELKDGQHVVIGDGNNLLTSGPTVYGHEGIVRYVTVDRGLYSDSDAAGKIIIEPLDNEFDLSNRLARGDVNNFIVGLSELHFTSGSTEPTLGQQLTGATSTNDAWVFRVELQSGSWSDGDAAGIIYCYEVDGKLTDGETMNLVSPVTANILTLTEALYGSKQDRGVIYLSETESSDIAGLYRSSREGWSKVDLGWAVRFSGGANEPTPIKFGADTLSATVTASGWKIAKTQRDWGGWAASAGSELNAVGASGGAYINPDAVIGTASIEEAERYFVCHNFGFVLPEGARVVGVEIEITAKNVAAATAGAALINVQPFLNDASIYEGGRLPGLVTKRQSIDDLTNAFVAYTFGGANDLWGADITTEMVEDSNFGMKFTAEWDANATYTDLQVDFIRMRVHYVEQGQRVYFYDTGAVADYTSARLVHLHVETGTWGGANATGILYLYDLYKSQIPTKNIQIRTAAAGGGSLIANMVGTEFRPYLPGSIKLKENESKYEMIAENAYARDDLAAIYGVSGAGRAFSYDGHYVRFVHSGLSPDLDKPRHVSLFQFRLWLGYGFGEAAISTAGEPLVFDGSLNAVATGFGRRITGLMPLAGKTMGVYTDRSVYAVTVSGADFDQQVFAPKAGALEYTLQNVGQTAMYLDMRGISAPYATQNYGDFDIGRISKLVNPWLLPRIQGLAMGTVRSQRHAVATSVARSKNQYRIYFADGYRLTVTTDGQTHQITRQFLYTDNDTDHYVKVLATDADVDEKGQDRMFFTMDINPDYDHDEALGFCYEEDRGTSYDGSSYKKWIELSAISGVNIHLNTVWNLMHFYGMSHGYTPLKMTTAVNFAHPADADDTTEDSRYSLALGAAANDVTSELKAYFDKVRTARRGRHLSIRLQGESDQELPHLLQHIALDGKEAREER